MTISEKINLDDVVSAIESRQFRQLVDGVLTEGANTIPVIDPATEAVIATAPVGDAAQLDRAVAAAKRAFKTWQSTSHAERVVLVGKVADAIEARREEIARIITLEVGKPIAAARADVDLSLLWAREVAKMPLEDEVLRDDSEARIELRRRPVGVVAAIIPWNFPFFQTVYKLVPALLTGNCVVIKPSPTTPLNAMVLAEILQPIVPAGVVNIVGDSGDLGPHLAGHPDVDKVSFTGSTAAGRKVMASGAATLKRIVLELGGNDAAVVMEDADVTSVARSIFSWAFMNSGQVCINIKRVYVPESLHDAFCDEFVKLAREAKVGHGLDETNEYGPLQNRRQYEAVLTALDIAKRDGKVIAGGHALNSTGYFVAPTVVCDIDESSPLVREETFGPIRSIMSYKTIDEVVSRVNDTQYGLGNSVWGRDVEKATRVAARLVSGTTWVNTHFALAPDVPFGGVKQSGLGVEFGLQGLHEFTLQHVINISRVAL